MSNEIRKVGKSPKSKGKIITAGILAILGVSTVLGAQAYTGSRLAQHVNIEGEYSDGSGKIWKTGWRGGGRHFGSMSAAEREKQIARMVGHLAVEIDATDEQQEKLVTLIKSVADDMLPMKEKMRESREEAIKILTAATVDRAALETMRVEKLAEADTISKNLTKAVADAAEILAAEQRQTVADRIEMFHKMKGRWRH